MAQNTTHLPDEIFLSIVGPISNDYRELQFGSDKDKILSLKHTLLDLCLISRILCAGARSRRSVAVGLVSPSRIGTISSLGVFVSQVLND